MASPAAVSVHNDLSSSEPGIASGSTNDKPPGRIDIKNSVLIYVFFRNHLIYYHLSYYITVLNDKFLNLLLDLFIGDRFGVLHAHQYGMDPYRLDHATFFLILHSHLPLNSLDVLTCVLWSG